MDAFRPLPGVGVEGMLDGRLHRLVRSRDETRTGTVVDLERDGRRLASFVLETYVRPEAHEVLRSLSDRGLDLSVLTGDSHAAGCGLSRALDVRVEEVTSLATKLHAELEAAGVDVLLDDRDQRPGFKFKDAELIGFPIRITVGKRGLADGIVEVQTRRTGETQKIAPEQVAPTVKKMVESAILDERTDDA